MTSGSVGPPTRQYKRHSASEWDEQKPHIRELYIDESKTLDEVVEAMKVQHAFLARYFAVSFCEPCRLFSDMLINF
jgi:Clr5 domain